MAKTNVQAKDVTLTFAANEDGFARSHTFVPYDIYSFWRPTFAKALANIVERQIRNNFFSIVKGFVSIVKDLRQLIDFFFTFLPKHHT